MPRETSAVVRVPATEAGIASSSDSLGAAAGVELGEDRANIVPVRLRAEEQSFSDRVVREPARDKLDDLGLASRGSLEAGAIRRIALR